MEPTPRTEHNLSPAMLDDATMQDIAALTATELNLLRLKLAEDENNKSIAIILANEFMILP